MDPFGAGATFGLLALERSIKDYFAQNTISAAVDFGWTARFRKDNQGAGQANRVIVMPGKFDPSTGEPRAVPAGRIDRNGPSDFVDIGAERIRVLAWIHEDVTLAVWASDPTAAKDERLAYGTSRHLTMVTIQAIHNAVDPLTGAPVGFGNIEDYGDTTWTLPPGEVAFGREFMFGLVLRSPWLAAPFGVAFPTPVIERAA